MGALLDARGTPGRHDTVHITWLTAVGVAMRTEIDAKVCHLRLALRFRGALLYYGVDGEVRVVWTAPEP